MFCIETGINKGRWSSDIEGFGTSLVRISPTRRRVGHPHPVLRLDVEEGEAGLEGEVEET